MRILLLGKNGQVGWELQRTLLPIGEVIAFGSNEVNLADFKAIIRIIKETKPNFIVNAAAYTDVDRAEEEPELAMVINSDAVGVIAETAKTIGAALIHYSTDYIFDGKKNTPYTEEDEPNPINVYGKTKAAGEKVIRQVGVPFFIFRTSWVYGLRGKNFLLTIMRLAREREKLFIVNDQFGSPTWSRMIAETTSVILAKHANQIDEKQGIYNLSSGGEATWYDFANEILARVGKDMNVCLSPIATSEYKTPASRPTFSVLSNKKLTSMLGISIHDWRYCLKIALEDLI